MGQRKTKKKNSIVTNVHLDWVISHEMTINGRHVETGTEVSVKGESGRFRFIKHVKTPKCEWVDVVGGPANAQKFRSFRPEAVKTVHRLSRIRPTKGKL
jgi:hypothetical protein